MDRGGDGICLDPCNNADPNPEQRFLAARIRFQQIFRVQPQCDGNTRSHVGERRLCTVGQEHACRTAGRACAAAADRTGLEAAAVGGNPYQPLDPGLEFSDARVGRTDRPGFIVSSLTINEFYLHNLPLPVCGSLQNDASIVASFRLSGCDAHSPSPWRSSIG